MLHAAQGGDAPERIHVILGTGETETFRLAEFSAYFRRVRARFLASFAVQTDTYPEPVSHCDLCRWAEQCKERRANDDHLSLVAGINRGQRAKLVAAGVETLEALGKLAPADEIPGIRPEQLEKRREQARLQLLARETRRERSRGSAAGARSRVRSPPEPSEGDVSFDLEGDPFL